MMDLTISIEDQVVPLLKRFGDEKNQSRILNWTLSRIGKRYQKYVRFAFLQGQQLRSRGGSIRPDSLWNRIIVYKKPKARNVYTVGEKGRTTANATNVRLANIYEHAGGYTIIPKKKMILWFQTPDGFWHFAKKIEGKQRPFMSDSFKSFNWNNIIKVESEAVIKEEIAKAGLA